MTITFIDIGSFRGFPGDQLSNFAAHKFVFDGVECASMEGFLQSLKFEDVAKQTEVCKLVGIKAKNRGRKRNNAWKKDQTLWWRGFPMSRHGKEYQKLLDMAFLALFNQSELFKKALLETVGLKLIHSIGWDDANETILTENEFCSRLRLLRDYVLPLIMAQV